MVQDLERCLVGGTFDRFHKGHEHLLKESLKRTQFLEVWITSDAMASKKSDLVEPFSKRRHSVLEWADVNAKGLVKTFELKDFGTLLKYPTYFNVEKRLQFHHLLYVRTDREKTFQIFSNYSNFNL